MSTPKSPSYDRLKHRLEAVESALTAIREGRVDKILGEQETLVVRLAEAEAREAHLKQLLLAIHNVNQLIVAENDPRRLIERACVNLTETMGYHNAWIALLGGEAGQELGLPEAGPVAAAAAAGFDGGFEFLRGRIEREDFPECMVQTLASEDVFVVEDPAADCPDCPLSGHYGGRAGLVRRLEYDGVTWGILTASVPAAYARDDEEQALFNEVAGDLAFALYKIAAAGKLEESRRRYREIFENSRDGFVMVDDSGRILDANGAYCEMLGYTLDELRALPDFYAITPPRWHAWENEEIWRKRLLGQGCSGLYEKEYIRKDGTIFPVELRSYVVRRENGDIDYLWGTARDITRRKQAEDALRRQHAMLARTEALAHVGSWEWDIANDQVRWSDELFRIFKRDPGEGAPSFAQHPEIYLPDDMERLKKAVERCVSNGTPYELDLRAMRSDGEIRHCVARGQAETDETGRIVRLAGSLQDLTEEKNLVREIQDQRNRMESLMQAIPAPVFFKDKNGRYLGCNPAFETLTGSTRAQITGKTVHEVWPEKYSSTYRDKDMELLETGGSQQYEFNLVDDQGKERDVVFYKSAFEGQSGKIEGLVGVILDITERKAAEEALRKSESRVRTKLNALLDPEGDIGTLHLADIVDCDEIQSLMNDFHALTDIGIGILDLDGNVLVGTGWQDVCVKFHRVHPETEKLCRESDLELTSGVEPGTFKIYKCKNNMWDMVTPIVIGGKHVGNLFLGQFFFEDEAPDIAIFREQARRYGFDEEVYLKAYRAIPRWSRQKIDRVMTFYCNLIKVISRLSYAHIKLARATEAFNAANTKLTLAMQAAGQGLWEWNLITDVIHFDDAALDMLGYRQEDIRGPMESGTWWMGRVHSDDRSLMEERFNRYVSGKEKDYHVEFRLKTKDGGYRWMDSSARLLSKDEAGNPEMVVGIHLDITERKRAEDRQKNLATELEEILDALPDAVVYADKDRRIKKVNPSFTRIFGYSQDEILGKKTRIIYRNDEEYLEQGRKRYNPQASQMWEPYEIYHVRKDGTEFVSETVGTPVRNAQGEVVGLLGLVRDITEKKESESENEKLQVQLRQAQKMEAVGRLAGGVAHDFNNMLSIVIGHADMILEDLKPDQPFYAALMAIRQAGARSADLTRQLLAFARKQTVAPKVIDLNKTVESMLKMLKRLIGEDIDLAWIPGDKVWPVKIDPGQIDQILANLCVNARDAIADVGKMSIETGNTTFEEDCCRDHAGFAPGEYAMMAVSDNGCGMDAETLSHMFEPFFTTKELGKGTGLGLATVYGVVKQNNGLINVYSEPGQGTTFKIYLPRHKAKTTPLPKKGTDKPSGRGHETVLLVEDEPSILRMTTMMLERQGYKVVGASTPGEAVRLAAEHAGDIHLLMTDVVMPEMNGRDLAKNILSLYPGLKCLFMSGYTANVIAHHGVLDEGVNFIQKPFSKEDLTAKVRAVLDD